MVTPLPARPDDSVHPIEDALRESEARYRTLAELSPDATLIASEMRFVYANPAAARLLGAGKPEEIAGVEVFRFVAPGYHELARDRIRRTLEEHSTGWRMESRWVRLDGTEVDVELSAAEVMWQGAPAIQVIARDITERKQLERDRAASLARFTALIDNIREGVLIETEERTIFTVNPAFCRLFGITAPPEALAGSDCRNAAETVKHLLRDAERFPSRIAEIVEARVPVGEEEVVFADGRAFARDYVPISTAAGAFIGHMWRYRDITERKRTEEALRESEERYRLVAQASDDVVWDWSLETGRVVWSQNLDRVLGYPANKAGSTIEEAMQWWSSRIHPDDRERVVADFQRATAGPGDTWREEYRFLRGDGEYVSIVDVGHIGRNEAGEPARMVGAMRDVTELARARANAEAASEAKSRFLSTLSHELRTPLNAVIGVADLLGSEIWGSLTPSQAEQVRRIKGSAWHLVSIIDEILTFTRAEAGKEEVRLEQVDLVEIVRGVTEMLGGEAQRRELTLRVLEPAAPIVVTSDGGKVRQILVNLVGNAIKYTKEGSVEVELESHPEEVAVHIRDTGMGIPAERLQEVFEPFVQLESAMTRTQGGTGLGLAICRKLARMLGGDVTVESTVGRGSTFRLRLPRTAPPRQPEMRPAPRESREAGTA